MLYPLDPPYFYVDSWHPDIDKAFHKAVFQDGSKVDSVLNGYAEYSLSGKTLYAGFNRFQEAVRCSQLGVDAKMNAQAIPLRDANKVHQTVTLPTVEVYVGGGVDVTPSVTREKLIAEIDRLLREQGLLSSTVVLGGYTADSIPDAVEYVFPGQVVCDDQWVLTQSKIRYVIMRGEDLLGHFSVDVGTDPKALEARICQETERFLPPLTPQGISQGDRTKPLEVLPLNSGYDVDRSEVKIRYTDVKARLYDVSGEPDGWGFIGEF